MKPKDFIQGTPQLAQAWPLMGHGDRRHIGNMFVHYEREFRGVKDHPNQEGAAASIHDLVDGEMARLMERPRADEVKCRRGCSACCRQYVRITKPEAVLLTKLCREDGIAVDWAKLERQKGYTYSGWHKQPDGDRACVFLDEQGACRVYEHRPDACRKYLVISEPKFCDTKRYPGHRVVNFVSLEAETITSAAMVAFENGSMPAMLLKWR